MSGILPGEGAVFKDCALPGERLYAFRRNKPDMPIGTSGKKG
jgi:hypothetical protein